MTILGFEISRAKAVPATTVTPPATLQGIWSSTWNRGWFRIFESWAGAWQHNEEITLDNVTTHPAIFACVTLIANDIGKMRCRLVQQDANGIWVEVMNPAFSPVLRRPNHYQNRIQFVRSWILSMLLHGNAYILKVRDARRVVTGLYTLDPQRVRPLVAPNGDVYYELKRDDLDLLPEENYTVPASEIIHDHWNEFFHPLCGLSPIYAAGLAAIQGLNIQNSSAYFFQNGSNPGGVIEVPGDIAKDVASRIKEAWDQGFTGENAGKVAVLANGMKYTQLRISAVDSQVVEQLKWTDETICNVFHVPPYMAGFGPPPSYNNVEALNQQYYSQCLQVLVEGVELNLDEGLGLTVGEVATQRYGTEFDLDDLLRMDSKTQVEVLEKGKNYYTPNEGRLKLNLPPKPGGDAVYRQQQDYSIEALNKRDSQEDPFAPKTPPALAAPEDDDDDGETPEDEGPDTDAEAETERALRLIGLRYRAMAIAERHLDEQRVA